MNKIYLSALFLMSLFVSNIKAQQSVIPCLTDQHNHELEAQHPEMRSQKLQFESQFKEFLKTYDLNEAKRYGKSSAPKYIIPVVVHVLHSFGSERISLAQIQSEIDFLNKSFQKLNPDTVNIRPIFKDIAGNAQIEFRLARRDPQGNKTNGIVYKYTPLSNKGDDNLKKISSWNSQRYLNIWIVERINRQVNNGIIAGYAQFPFGGMSASTDGIIINYSFMGQTGSITPPSSSFHTTVTHEIGHWLGLYHPFQGDTCDLDNDGVGDTPPRRYSFENDGTPNFCSRTDSNSCSSDNPDLPDMYENYMDYFGGSCSNNMFTVGQVARMHFCLNAYRPLLWSPENLVFTGVADISQPNDAPPIASFEMANNQALAGVRVCVGNTVTFRDNSYNAAITNWEWNFGDGASPATHTGQAPPPVTYSTAGKKTITLTVTGPNGSNTLTATDYLTVEGPADSKSPFQLGADWDYLNNFQEQGWYFENETPGTNPWGRIVGIQLDEIASLRLNSRLVSSSFRYSLISPSYNLTGLTNPYFSFSYAFAPNLTTIRTNAGSTTGDSQDRLFVFISTDCGRTWLQRATLGGDPNSTNQAVRNPLSTLTPNPSNNNATGVQNNINFIPSDRNQWKEIMFQGTTQIPAEANVRFKITFQAAGGNHFYIDNLRMGINTSVSEMTKSQLAFNAYPNPFNNTTKLTYTLLNNTPVLVKVYDVMGREIATVADENQTAGTHELTVSKNELGMTKGVYIVKIILGTEAQFSHKLIVE